MTISRTKGVVARALLYGFLVIAKVSFISLVYSGSYYVLCHIAYVICFGHF